MKNAVDYGDPAKPIRLMLREADDAVSIAVRNEGPEIPAETLADIFDPFKRGAVNVQTRSDGLGLGLYIVERIASGHGGCVAVESSALQGTTFTATLPHDGVERRPKSL
jgi:signal transduction histidine kinase